MKKNYLLILVCISLFSSNAFGQKQQQRPNILWIVANDISPDLACYGNKLVHTPHLDKLAGEGVLYKNMITQARYARQADRRLLRACIR